MAPPDLRREAGVRLLCATWSRLRAWDPVKLYNLTLTIKRRRGTHSTGLAISHLEQIILRLGEDQADGLATLLHELAHLAAFRRGASGHDEIWKRIYRDAAKEIFGAELPSCPEGLLTELVRQEFVKRWSLEDRGPGGGDERDED